MANKTGKNILESIVIALAIVVMVVVSALIVATLTSNTVFTDISASGSVTNETGFINSTGYTLGQASLSSFEAGTLVVLNATDNSTILAGNYTLADNVLTNATATTWPSVRISYDYTYSTGANLAGLNVTQVSSDFGSFVTNLIAFLAVIGTIVGVVWLVLYVQRLFSKKTGIQGITA